MLLEEAVEQHDDEPPRGHVLSAHVGEHTVRPLEVLAEGMVMHVLPGEVHIIV